MYHQKYKELNKVIMDEVNSGVRFIHGETQTKLSLAGGGFLKNERKPSDQRILRNVKEDHARLSRRQAQA